jgi:hypothetical protein
VIDWQIYHVINDFVPFVSVVFILEGKGSNLSENKKDGKQPVLRF